MKIHQFGGTSGLFIAALWLLCLTGCLGYKQSEVIEPATGQGKPYVVASNLPLRFFAQCIAGKEIEVQFLVPGDEDPAYWEPPADAVQTMQNADLVFLNGAGYESWLPKVTLREARLINTSQPFQSDLIELKDVVTHSHGPTGEHTHGGVAKTTWIDFQQAHAQARMIVEAMIQRWPDKADVFTANWRHLDAELVRLDQSMAAVSAKIGQRPLVVSHPEYDYWARRYQLQVASVHWEAGEIPGEEALSELKRVLADHPASIMVWEAEPAPEAVEILNGMGIRSVVFAPRGNDEGSRDWLALMQENIANLESAVAQN